MRLLVSCALGTERALGNELRRLGLAIAESGKGRFEVEATLRGALAALRCLRCAERVFAVLGSFPAYQFEDLFQGVKALPWGDWLPADARIHIDKVRLFESALNSVASVQAVAQKAAYATLCARWGLNRMPETGATHLVRVYVERNRAMVCLDLAGDALHKRGYRTKAGEAPLRESLAAALILLSGWRRKHPFHDPFCGSGTLAAEALLYAAELPPNLRRRLAVQDMRAYEPAVDRELVRDLEGGVAAGQDFLIRASDMDPDMVALCRRTIDRAVAGAGLDGGAAERLRAKVVVEHGRMEGLRRREAGGHFFANPPWGERLGDQESAMATQRALSHLGGEFPDWGLSVVSTWPGLAGALDRRCEWRKPVRNGNAESWFYLFPPLAAARSD